jgi:cell division protein FtsB
MKKSKFIIPKKYIPYLRNKYILTFLAFIIWLSFFDRNDFITTWSYHKKLESLRNEQSYYKSEVKKYTDDLNNLITDHSNMEKYAREKYYMKKDNEDVFVIIDERKKVE